MPTLADPNFAKTVTYIYAHDEGGAFGIVINRPVDIRFSELLDHMEITSTSPAAFSPGVFRSFHRNRSRVFKHPV